MLSEGQVRALRNTMKDNLNGESNVSKAIAFASALSILDMVLEDGTPNEN